MGRLPLKKQIIDNAAIELFATKGLAETSIRDVSTKAGVTVGALYRYYKSKNEMAWELFCKELDVFTQGLKAIVARNNQPVETLKKSIEYIYEYYEKEPLKFAFILLTQHGFPDEQLLDEENNPNDVVIRGVKALFDEVTISDHKVLAGMLMGAILQPIVMHNYGRFDKPVTAYVDDVVSICIKMIKP